jgi:hypothetical protein
MTMSVQQPQLTATMRDIRLLHCDGDLALGAAPDLFVTIWRDRTTLEGVEILQSHLADFARDRSKELALLTIIEAGAKMPAVGTREPLARVLNGVAEQVLISGVAFEGEGFLAASIRSVVVGLTLIARQPFPHRTFKDVEEVARWFESERASIGKHFEARAVQRMVATFRRQVAMQP